MLRAALGVKQNGTQRISYAYDNLSRRDALVEVNGAVVEDDGEEEAPRRNNGGNRDRRGFKKRDK